MDTYRHFSILPFVLTQWSSCSAKHPLNAFNIHQKPKASLKMQSSNQGITPPGIFTLCTQWKANLMPSTLLTGCHNHHLSISQLIISDGYNELMMDPSLLQSFSEDEWMSIHRLPYLCALHFHIVSEKLFTQLTSPALLKKCQGWLHHQCQQKSYEHWDHSPGNFGYSWGRWGKAGNDNYFLQIWSSEGGAFGCTLNLSPVGLTQARCSSGEDLH